MQRGPLNSTESGAGPTSPELPCQLQVQGYVVLDSGLIFLDNLDLHRTTQSTLKNLHLVSFQLQPAPEQHHAVTLLAQLGRSPQGYFWTGPHGGGKTPDRLVDPEVHPGL